MFGLLGTFYMQSINKKPQKNPREHTDLNHDYFTKKKKVKFKKRGN